MSSDSGTLEFRVEKMSHMQPGLLQQIRRLKGEEVICLFQTLLINSVKRLCHAPPCRYLDRQGFPSFVAADLIFVQ